jgi:GT2 family glycosyltransferase
VRFTIIIVSWNALPLLQRFLPSVAATRHDAFEILLADNASTDGSVAWVKQHYPAVRIATFDHNYGYCGGNNRGAREAKGEWLVFLNNDVETDPDWLNALDRFITSHPEIAILQPKLRAYNAPESFEYAGASGGFLDTFGYPFCRGRVFDQLDTDRGQYETPEFISWASGAAFCIRKSVFDFLSGFEETFEFHMEEIDLCWRAWRAGYSIAVVPESVVYHLGGGSLQTGSYRKWFYNIRNGLFMLARNDFRPGSGFRFFLRMVLDGLTGLQQTVLGHPHVLKAVFMAHMDFYRHLKTVWRWRKAGAAVAEKGMNMPRFNGLLPFHFFVLKKRTFDTLADRINRTML